MPDPMLDSLFDDTSRLDWPAAAEVRRSANRTAVRHRIAGVAAAAVAVALIGGGAFAVTNRAGPAPGPDPVAASPSASELPPSTPPPSTPPPSPSTSVPTQTRPTKVPTTVMLQPSDLASGQWSVEENGDEGDWSFGAIIGYCRAAPDHPGDPTDRRLREISGPGESRDGVVQEVQLSGLGRTNALFDYYRNGAIACASHVSRLGDVPMKVRILAEGFAGQRSMLVESESQYGTGRWVIVVQDCLFTQMSITPDGVDYAKQVARRAAARLDGFAC